MDTKSLVLHLLLLLTLFTIRGKSTFLPDQTVGLAEPEGSALQLTATDRVSGFIEKLVKPTPNDLPLGEAILAKAKDTVEAVLQQKDEFISRAKDKVGNSLKTFEEEGSALLTKAKEKMANSLSDNEEILALAKDKVGSSLKNLEQEGSELLTKAKGKVEHRRREKDELVAKTKEKIGSLVAKPVPDEPTVGQPFEVKETSLLQRTKGKMESSLRAIEQEGNSLLNKAKDKVQNSKIIKEGQALLGKAKDKISNSPIMRTKERDEENIVVAKNESPERDDLSLLEKAKETMENSFLMKTLTKEGSLLGKAKETVEKSFLGKTLKEGENFILSKARETAEGAKKFSLLSGNPFNSLFSTLGSGTPKISGLKLLSPLTKESILGAPAVEVDDFQYPLEPPPLAPTKHTHSQECYKRPPPRKEKPITPVLPENEPLDYDKIKDGYYEDSREFTDDSTSLSEYDEIEADETYPALIKHRAGFTSDEVNKYTDEEDLNPDHYSESSKGHKRQVSYDFLHRRPKSQSKRNNINQKERFHRGIENVKKLITIAGQVDSFLSGKIRNSLKSLSHMYENEDEYKYGGRR
ncbi:hypothetical protein DMENIID0001_049750 [Sergentomyia squamirostris]